MGEMSVEGRPHDEEALVERAKNGDLSAYEELARTYQGISLRVAYLVVRDHGEAEDVVQEAMVKVYRNLARFRADSPFRPWLLRIVRNEALNRVRRRSRQERLSVRLAADPVSGGAAPSPETVVFDQARARSVLAAVDTLPERYRSVVSARFLVGLNEAETAQMLGIPTGTVKSRTSRALDRLRKLLEGLDD